MARGFSGMPSEKRRAIASKGGLAAHAKGAAHQWTQAEAKEAGRRGGLASQAARSARSQNRTDLAAARKALKEPGRRSWEKVKAGMAKQLDLSFTNGQYSDTNPAD